MISPPPPLPVPALLSSFAAAPAHSKRLILLDYDGTVSYVIPDSGRALPTPRLRRALAGLCRDPRNSVWIVSGRPGDFLEANLGDITGLGMSAEHGGFRRDPGSTEWAGEAAADLAEGSDLRRRVSEALHRCVDKLQGMTYLESKMGSFALTYRMAQQAQPETTGPIVAALVSELTGLVQNYPDISVKLGSCVVEVRPDTVHKGVIARELIGQHGYPPFVLCAGDEPTDEDMYAAAHALVGEGKLEGGSGGSGGGVWTVFVKREPLATCARWSLDGVDEVWALLERMAGLEEYREGATV